MDLYEQRRERINFLKRKNYYKNRENELLRFKKLREKRKKITVTNEKVCLGNDLELLKEYLDIPLDDDGFVKESHRSRASDLRNLIKCSNYLLDK